MPEYTINSISEYVEKICEINAELDRNGAEKHEVALFRGHSDKTYKLMPSLGRGRAISCSITIFDEERNLIEMAKYRMPDVFKGDMQPVELLALLQHFGIPTRLLDITENPLIALYFACVSNEEKDGEVIVFKNNERDITIYPVVNAIADSYRFARGTFTALTTLYESAIEQPYFLEHKHMVGTVYSSEEAAANWIAECCKRTIFVCAPIRTQRQYMQRGRYILFPNRIESGIYGNIGHFSKIIDPIDKNCECIAGRIIIPQTAKSQLSSDLKLLGISKGTVFSDSIDCVCEDILAECKYRVKGDPIKGVKRG